MNKIDKIILKRVSKDLEGKNNVTFDEFLAHWYGNLMFLYVDTFGIPERTVKEIFYETFC